MSRGAANEWPAAFCVRGRARGPVTKEEVIEVEGKVLERLHTSRLRIELAGASLHKEYRPG